MENKVSLDNLRHSTAHLLAAAVMELWPDTKRAIGPAIENGFYFDFEFTKPISESDLTKIEEVMLKILPSWKSFEKHELSSIEAKKEYPKNPYKHELIDEFSEKGKKKISFFKSGNYWDLCKGGHVEHPSEELKHFKLLSIAGAYWRGNEKNKMLTRIYGTVFPSQKELEDYLEELAKRKENDHRTIGKKLDLFAFSDLVGKGLVMYTPKGTVLKTELRNALLDISYKYGVKEVNIPHFAKIDLYKTSGHADKFKGELFKVVSHYKEEFVLKPVNCPHHTQLYASQPRSYKDLPIRYIESTQQHRDEKPGEIGGLYRSRSFEVDDGHTFCTPNQIKTEVINTIKIIEEFYKSLGMWGNHWVSLSFKDPNDFKKYIGEKKDWETAQTILKEVSDELGLNAKIMEGEAAIYGPKIDFMLKDAQSNDRQLGTVQVDFAMPQRFGLTYVDEDGKEKTPVMMHRAILGSYGRFIANLIEKTGGAFPVWLSPVQVVVITISEESVNYGESVYNKLFDDKVRVEIDLSDETMQNKIRKAQEQKVPYMIIVGKREMETNNISVRKRDGSQENGISLEMFTKSLKDNIMSKSLDV